MDIKTYQQSIKVIERKSAVVDSIHQKILTAKDLEKKIDRLHNKVDLEEERYQYD